MKDFDLEYNIMLFRKEQKELFNPYGERYTTPISYKTAELMLTIINELESKVIDLEAFIDLHKLDEKPIKSS